MKRLATVLIIALAPALAQQPQEADHGPYRERTIEQASALALWCRSEAESRYIAKDITPYQWTASHHDRHNVLYVEGRLRVHGDDVAVRCRIAKGARERYATIEIDDPSL
jgi:hypothetical protein